MSSIDRVRYNTLADCKICCSNLFSIPEEVEVCEVEGCELFVDCGSITPPNGAPSDFRDLCETGRDFRYMGFSNQISANNFADVCNEGGQVTVLSLPSDPTAPFFVDTLACNSCCDDLNDNFDGPNGALSGNNCKNACNTEKYCFDLNRHDNRLGCAVGIDFLTLGEVDYLGNILTCNSLGQVNTLELTQQPSNTPSSSPTHTPTSTPTSSPSEVPSEGPSFSPSATINPSRSPSRGPLVVSTSSPTDSFINDTVSVSSFAPSVVNVTSESNMIIIALGAVIALILFTSISVGFSRYRKRNKNAKAMVADSTLSSTLRYRFTVSTLGSTFKKKKKTSAVDSANSTLPGSVPKNSLESGMVPLFPGVVFENDDGEMTQISF